MFRGNWDFSFYYTDVLAGPLGLIQPTGAKTTCPTEMKHGKINCAQVRVPSLFLFYCWVFFVFLFFFGLLFFCQELFNGGMRDLRS